MNPLAVEIWLSMALAYFFVSITIFAVARFSPLEWQEEKLHPRVSKFRAEMSNVCDDHKQEAAEEHHHHHHHQHQVDDDHDDHQHHHHCEEDDHDDYNKYLFDSITQKQYMQQGHQHVHDHHGCDSDDSSLFNNESDLLHEGWSSLEYGGGPCRHHNATELISLKNDFTLKNSFWFTLGTLLQQGSDLNPKVFFLFFFFICLYL
jgi:Ligand-gated ion channel